MIGIHHGCDAVDKSAVWDEWEREWACSYVVVLESICVICMLLHLFSQI